MCFAGCHRVLAWLASFSLIGWLWYFIDLHRVRYSHAGHVCFGDYLNSISGTGMDLGREYLLTEGAFLRYMLISQWLFISLIAYGLLSNLIVIVMWKVEAKEALSKQEANGELPIIVLDSEGHQLN